MPGAFLDIVRIYGDEGTPVPIPNTVVKLIYGDNTWLATAWKDNSMRTSAKAATLVAAFLLFEEGKACINIFYLIWMGH